MYNNDIVMLAGGKYEIFLEMQRHNWLIFTKIILIDVDIMPCSPSKTILEPGVI
jgi:hypothetical protein